MYLFGKKPFNPCLLDLFMASPTGFVEGGKAALSVLSPEIAGQVLLLIQAIGGLFVVYLIFLGIRLYFLRKQRIAIDEMRQDIKKIKKRLKIR